MTDANKKNTTNFLHFANFGTRKKQNTGFTVVMAFVQRDLSHMLGSVLKEININLFKVISIYTCMSAFVPGW